MTYDPFLSKESSPKGGDGRKGSSGSHNPFDSLTPAKVSAVLIVGRDATARAVALGAARLAYPQAAVVELAGVAEAAKRPQATELELLVLLRPSPADFEKATQARDKRRLPRWPIVVFGDAPAGTGASVLVPQDWSPSVGAQVLGRVALLHVLMRDNERLRGDLRTIGRRIAHDLRTPLNCVSAAGEGIKISPDGSAASNEALTHSLLDAVGEIVVLIERVSFLVKATADPLPPKPVSMHEIVWAALQRLEGRMRRHGATVTQPESWPQVEGVASWLEVIWGSLISNSLEHGGLSPKLEIGWTKQAFEHHFWVSDSGPGVPGGKRPQLFEPFDRLHDLGAPRGLGLPIVQRLVEMQGGRCGYEQPEGGGVRFFFTLPALAAP
jgi:signal transduction histidine kinase